MKLLFLDDYRSPIDCASYMYRSGVDCTIYHKEWVIVRSYGQFVKWITENGLPDFISFDFDLGDVAELLEELPREQWCNPRTGKLYTGADCAKWLVNYCLGHNKPLPDYVVHSSKPTGKERIITTLKPFNRQIIDG